MKYLYGDSTPFPLDEDFLENLSELTRTAVSILQAEAATMQSRERSRQVVAETDHERKQLTMLGQSVLGAIRAHASCAPPPSVDGAAARLTQSTQGVVEVAQQELINRRDQMLRELDQSIRRERGRVRPLLEQYLVKHELPGTVWGLSWRVEASKQLEVISKALAVAECGLESSYRLGIPSSDRWSGPVRVGDLSPGLCVDLPRRSLLSKTPRMRPVRLAKLFITAADLSPERQALTLHEKAHVQRGGYELFQAAGEEPLVQPIDRAGTLEPTVHLAGAEAAEVGLLIQKAASELLPHTRRRAVLTDVALQEQPLTELEDLTGLATTMIGAVARLVREIVLRSPNSDELSLKRVVGERLREEVFVPTRELTSMIKALPPQQRVHFGPFGLGPPVPPTPPFEDTRKELVQVPVLVPELAVA
jgi:hypothetical protein